MEGVQHITLVGTTTDAENSQTRAGHTYRVQVALVLRWREERPGQRAHSTAADTLRRHTYFRANMIQKKTNTSLNEEGQGFIVHTRYVLCQG